MAVKHCVGPILYDDLGRVFLMESAGKFINPQSKVHYWMIPGGRIEQGEGEEAALRRETREELAIEITDIVKIDGGSHYTPENIFHKPAITFIFETYVARACSTDVRVNQEIREHGFFYHHEIYQRLILPPTKRMLDVFYADQRFIGLWK